MTKEDAQAKAREIVAQHYVNGVPLETLVPTALLSAERDGYRDGVRAMEPYAKHTRSCPIHLFGAAPLCLCGLDAAKGGE